MRTLSFLAYFAFTSYLTAAVALAEQPSYGVGDWPEKYGNHRARVQVAEGADAIWIHIPWRRRDANPQDKEIIVIDAATGKRVENVLRVNVGRDSGDLLFQPPTAPGEYHIYYMPFRTHGCIWWPTTVYPPPADAADADWSKRCKPSADRIRAGETAGITAARVVEFQAINEHHRFDPMELPATAYAKPGSALVSLASWAKEPVKCRLAIDWKSLGLDPAKAKLSAWEVKDFQPAAEFRPGDEIPVEPGRGWLLVLHE